MKYSQHIRAETNGSIDTTDKIRGLFMALWPSTQQISADGILSDSELLCCTSQLQLDKGAR